MKAILGVDLQHAYLPALHLLHRLDFPEPHVLLVNTAQTVDAVLPPFPVDGATIDLVQNTFREAGEEALASAAAEAGQLNISTETLFSLGPSSEILDECVDESKADLIALRTTHRGAFQSEFMGSVTRAVVIGGTVSVLVAKEELSSSGPIDVVFATDGSTYIDECLDAFLQLAPRGIGKVHVVSAWGLSNQVEAVLRHVLHHSPEVDEKLRRAAEEAAERAAREFQAAGYQTSLLVRPGTPDRVLADAMKSTGADLLILGANGKNFVQRLFIGSTTLHQLIDEPYNLLLLRPRS